MNGLIICNGEIRDFSFYKKYFNKADLVICADGAAYHMSRFGVVPHILIGDFDSITTDEYNHFLRQGVKIKKFPAEKDKTDTELAVEYALDAGCREITLIGAVGSRIDHTLSNVFLLKKIVESGACGWIVDEKNQLTLIKKNITLVKEHNEKVSILPLSEKVEGITTKGLYYPLCNATLVHGSSRGISNEFTGVTAEITVKKGLLLVLKSSD